MGVLKIVRLDEKIKPFFDPLKNRFQIGYFPGGAIGLGWLGCGCIDLRTFC